MNKRINELAEQAGLSYLYDYDADGHAMVCSEKDIKKFAELIVKQCANIAAKNQAENMGWDISEIIKEHFGVEEQPICKHDWYSARNPVVKNGSVCVICGALDSREPEELKND